MLAPPAQMAAVASLFGCPAGMRMCAMTPRTIPTSTSGGKNRQQERMSATMASVLPRLGSTSRVTFTLTSTRNYT